MSIRTRPQPMLSAALIRRRPRPLLLARPSADAADRAIQVPEPISDWSDDLRFFATCYAAGVAFFLIMLS